MHIPDGFLSRPVWVGMDIVSMGAVGAAVRRVNQQLDPERVPLMGMAAAWVFAAQLINFPVLTVGAGVSGHLLGGFLAALLLGPAAAVIVMTVVFAAQCLLFQDGGLLALGANLFNMGLLGSLGGYGIYRLLTGFRLRDTECKMLDARCRIGERRLPIPHPTSSIQHPVSPISHRAIAVAAWLSVMLGATAASLEMAASGVAPLRMVLPAMLGVHALIGIGEALITVGAVALLLRVRPDLLKGAAR